VCTTTPFSAIAGGDFTRPGRRADLQLMRHLRACADAFSIGAQTLRDRPDLVGAADDIGGALGEALHQFRAKQGRRRFPIQVVYSESGRLDLDAAIFNTSELTAIVVTGRAGSCTRDPSQTARSRGRSGMSWREPPLSRRPFLGKPCASQVRDPPATP